MAVRASQFMPKSSGTSGGSSASSFSEFSKNTTNKATKFFNSFRYGLAKKS